MSAFATRHLSAREISLLVSRLAGEISRDHPGGVVLLGMLKDGVFLLADLGRQLTVPCVVDFLSLSAYQPGTRRVRLMKDLDVDLTGLDVVVVRNIVDTGLSVPYLLDLVRSRGAARVRLCALLDRRSRNIVPLDPDYLGAFTEVPFLVGYGLDLEERFRNLPDLYAVDPASLLDASRSEVDALFA